MVRFFPVSCFPALAAWILIVCALTVTIVPTSATPTFTSLYSFPSSNINEDGGSPEVPMLQGSDGNFYGTTHDGGTAGYGTAFKMTPAGVLTTLVNFTYENGSSPNVLVEGSDGNFYGTTEFGGTQGSGTVFEMSPLGALTTLADFEYSETGAYPVSGLVQGTDGNFYGTTQAGGANRDGTAFSISPTGLFSTLYNFDYMDGYFANGLVQGSDGNLYGTTVEGGSANNGTIFQLTGPVPVPTWSASDVAAASSGTARILWTRSDGAAGLWIMSAANTQTSHGPTYGPYSDSHGTWSAKAIGTASDGTTKMLWTRSDGAAGVWTLNAAGTQTAIGPTYGPYSDSHGTWSAVDVAAGPGGTARVLWVKSDGTASVWTMSASDAQSTAGPSYGPYTGWTAKAVGASGDGTARILWTRSDGAAGLWTLNAANVETAIGTTYGPYSDSHGTWSAGDMATSADGTSNVLWNRSDGAAGVWTFNAAGTETKVGPVYGPYAGFTASALDAASDQSRVLWVRSDRAAGLWTFGANDAESVVGTTYGPY